MCPGLTEERSSESIQERQVKLLSVQPALSEEGV